MTESEMRRMQEEAVRRTEEMQNRAKAQIHRQPEPLPQAAPKAESIAEERPVMPPPPKPKAETGGIFETLMKDKEQTLILSLILLLMDEQTDNSLIFALLYLLI